MTTGAEREFERAVLGIQSAKDVVDLLAVLLAVCRRHPGDVVAAGQSRELRARRAQMIEDAAAMFTSLALTDRTRSFAIEALRQAPDVVEAARALALGVDFAVSGRDTKDYVRLCLKFGTRTLVEDSPYPTPSVDLSAMYGPRGFSRRPRDGNAGTAFDRVDGLALWPSKATYPFDVVYDTVAGSYLDGALEESVDILAVSPNTAWENEFEVCNASASGIFGVRVLNDARQDDIIEKAIRLASEKNVDIVITPELSNTPETVERIRETLRDIGENSDRPCPSIVIAGGAHLQVGEKRVNRMTTIYAGRSPYLVTHDKVAKYAMAIPAGSTVVELEEDIDRSVELRIHAGVNWSMVTLICADFLEPTVVRAVSDLCPRVVVVPAMSMKTGDFERRIGEVISNCQALVVVANGPTDWFTGLGSRAAVAVFGLPLADSSAAVLCLTPAASAEAPFVSYFKSRRRIAEFIVL